MWKSDIPITDLRENNGNPVYLGIEFKHETVTEVKNNEHYTKLQLKSRFIVYDVNENVIDEDNIKYDFFENKLYYVHEYWNPDNTFYTVRIEENTNFKFTAAKTVFTWIHTYLDDTSEEITFRKQS